ncbi:MAG: 50S ribosomal protein L36 [Planctomycetota bacterium]|nr:50S ribosomal protein L36 [Planctomycetota bacterium]
MKVTPSIRKRCEHCKMIHRKGVLRIICKVNPRHKMRQG